MHQRKLLIFLGFIFCSFFSFAQEENTDNIDITGLWKGSLYNDSTKQNYRYEIGISEEKGKLIGFTHTWYNEHDYFVVKKVKVKRKDGKIIIEDVDIIAYNYPESPPKGVRRLHVLTLRNKDSILSLEGTFSTNRTKTYAPATGTINLQRKNDYRKHSDLMAHLQELGLEDEMSFVVKDKEKEKAEEEKSLTKSNTTVASNTAATSTTIKDPAIKNTKTKKVTLAPVADNKPVVVKNANTGPAAEVLSRKNVLQETMFFRSDSLELSLYDNGEVDGDTVSVLMNGTVVLAKQGLSTKAIRKTIQIPAGVDSVELVMYAESLGTIPPNTGLLIVKDGRDIYEIRFSGDLQKNAAIILKRKKT